MFEIQLHPFIPFAIFISFLLLLWFTSKSTQNKKSPPSPPKLPILGNLHQLGSLPHQSLHTLSLKHGHLMLLHFGSVPVLIASSADAACEIMKTHDLTFSYRPQYKSFKKLIYGGTDVTFLPYGDYWRQMKSILVQQLLSSKRVQSFSSIMEEETALFVRKIGESSGMVNLSEMFGEFANDVICRSAFGEKFRESEKGKKLVKLLAEFMVLFGDICVGDFIPWLSWIDRVRGFDKKLDVAAKAMDEFLEDAIQERIDVSKGCEKNGENFIDNMLEMLNEKEDGGLVGIESIKALLMDVLIGGTDTISTALEWTMTELLRHPTVMEKLQNEIRQTTKNGQIITEMHYLKAVIKDVLIGGTDTISTALEWTMTELLRHPTVMQKLQYEIRKITGDGRIITDNDISKMHYLKAVVKESLRYHPPLPLLVPRVARKDVMIKGFNISAGTVVMINVWAMGRDVATWDDAEKFLPERFLDSPVDFKGMDFELIPFGAGRRGCPGTMYAVAAMEFLLANILQKFNWKLGNGTQVEDLDMKEAPGITVHRAIPLFAFASNSP